MSELLLEQVSYLLISDVLEGVTHHIDAHVHQVGGCHFKDSLRKLLAVLVDFLSWRQLS